MKKEIEFEERKRIQLEMLDEIDEFCRKNNIRYSIAFGTLLGAVRHKGFIPWDDDVDIMMPLPDFIRFKNGFKSKISQYIDIDTDCCYEFPFGRVAHKMSYCKQGLSYKSYGICIDLYVMIGLPSEDSSFWAKAENLFKRRLWYIKWRTHIVRRFPIHNIPGFTKVVRQDRDFLYKESLAYQDADKYYVIAGPLNIREKMIYDKDLFANICDMPFEDRTYQAIQEWDYFLNLRYGNYMELPPIEERHPYHFFKYYWR